MKAPDLSAVAGIESPDVATWALGLSVTDPATYDDSVTAHRDWGCESIAKMGKLFDDALLEIQLTPFRKCLILLAGLGIDREQVTLLGTQKDSALASFLPVGHPTVDIEA